MGIVERLRNLAKLIDFKIGSNLASEAADLIERLREALERIADRPGEGVEYFPGHGDEVISEARNMELIARAALKEIEGD